jgi:hypothetical protein
VRAGYFTEWEDGDVKRAAVVLGLVLVVGVMSLPGSQAAVRLRYRDMYNVRGETLFKDRNPVVFRAVAFPELGDPAATYVDMMQAMHGTARVGGNGICFTLHGLSADGSSIDPAAVEQAKRIAKESKDRHMGAMVRVFAPDYPADLRTRERAARTVARAFRGEVKLLYWVDGPQPRRLARRFGSAARELVVVAEDGGDVLAAAAIPERAHTPVVLFGAIPEEGYEKTGFVLENTPASYDAIETAFTHPAELAPWTPDNSVLSEAERAEGFIALFNGRDLDGWYVTGSNKEGFTVKDGAIEWVARGASNLRSVRRYDDFVLRLEYRIAEGGNSGVHLRSPRAARASRIGFEFQMLGDHGKKKDKQSTGSIYAQVAPFVNASLPSGEWNTVEIICDGPHVKATLNGYVVQDLSFDDNEELKYRLRDGFIHLTDHGDPVSFRNVRLKPL